MGNVELMKKKLLVSSMAFSKSALSMDPFSGSRVLPFVPIPIIENYDTVKLCGSYRYSSIDTIYLEFLPTSKFEILRATAV